MEGCRGAGEAALDLGLGCRLAGYRLELLLLYSGSQVLRYGCGWLAEPAGTDSRD